MNDVAISKILHYEDIKESSITKFELIITTVPLELKKNVLLAVSYTHLDVYKRQLQEHTIIRMDLVHDEFFWYANFLIRNAANA